MDFELKDFSGEINMNNAMTSFELHVNGQLTNFYFWTFKETSPGVAKVQLRVEWPIDAEDFDKVDVSLRPVPLEKAIAGALITKHDDSKDDITITVTEIFANSTTKEIKETFPIDSNFTGVFKVGGYFIYVEVSGGIITVIHIADVTLTNANGKVTANFAIGNYARDDINVQCILAVYDTAGRMVKHEILQLPIGADTYLKETLELDLPESYEARAFIWKMPQGVPLCEAARVKG